MAGNLIVLRRRIKSVKNTQKLTKAMKTVAAAKLRRANGELKRSRAYREKIALLLRETGAVTALPGRSPEGTGAVTLSLLRGDEKGAVLLVVVAGDKGLCGAFNSHVLKQGEARYRELAAAGREVILVTVGSKASRYFSKQGLEPAQAHNGMIGRLDFADAARLGADLQRRFLSGGLHSVEFAFNEFVSASKQEFTLRRLFPIEVAAPVRSRTAGGAETQTYIFEPDAAAIFQALLPRFVAAAVYQMLLQSVAAEQMARMVAMDLASRNASDMIRELTLLLNKMRQAAITKELLEIITATEALNT